MQLPLRKNNQATPQPLIPKWRYTHPLAFQHHKGAVLSVSVGILLLLGWLDNITGYEFGFFIFYFIPVAVASWYGGRTQGMALAASSAVCWYISDRLTHHPYSRAYFIYWETFMRLLSFLTTSLTLSRIRRLLLNEEQLVEELMSARLELQQYRNPPPEAADPAVRKADPAPD